MRRIVIDASVSKARASIGQRGNDFVLSFPDHDAEVVFTDSGGTLYGAAVLAGGIGCAMSDKAEFIVRELLQAAEASVGANGRPN